MTTYEADFSTEQRTIKVFLEKIKGDILYIDGGCHSCISQFCEGVNETLSEYGLMLSFDKGAHPAKVDIVETRGTID